MGFPPKEPHTDGDVVQGGQRLAGKLGTALEENEEESALAFRPDPLNPLCPSSANRGGLIEKATAYPIGDKTRRGRVTSFER